MATRGGSDNGDLIFLALFGLAVGVGGIAVAANQQSKREREREQFRQQLEMLRWQLAQCEAKFRALCAQFGPKNEQVKVLANEVFRLRALVASREQVA